MWLTKLLGPPDYEQTDAYRAAQVQHTAAKPCESQKEQYSVLLRYAERRYDDQWQLFRALDEKAEKLFQFSAVGIGIVFTIARLREEPMTLLFSCAVGAMALAMLVALAVRMPAAIPFAMPLEHIVAAIGRDDTTDAFLALKLATNYERSAIGFRVLNLWKSSRIRWSSWLLYAAVVLLIVGLAVG